MRRSAQLSDSGPTLRPTPTISAHDEASHRPALRRARGEFGGVLAVAMSLVGLAATGAHADEEPNAPSSAPSVSPTSLAGKFGLAGLAAAVRSSDPAERARALQRAAAIANSQRGSARGSGSMTSATTSATTSAMGPRTTPWPELVGEAFRLIEVAATDASIEDPDAAARLRLLIARLLIGDPRRAQATNALRSLLVASVTRTTASPPPPTAAGPTWSPWGPGAPPSPVPTARGVNRRADPELLRLVRQTAAMGLAVHGDYDVLFTRARVHPAGASDEGEAGLAALGALRALPPSSLLPLLPRQDGPLPRDLVELLAALEDPRLADVLLGIAHGKDDFSSGVALRALARLGDGRAAAIALEVGPDSEPRLRLAAAETLLALHETTSSAYLLALATHPKLRGDAEQLAVRYPHPALISLIEPLARRGDVVALDALSEMGDVGVGVLTSLLTDRRAGLADAAAFVLARSPEASARHALIQHGQTPGISARRALRALVVRRSLFAEWPSGASDLADRLLTTPGGDAERFVSIFAASTTSAQTARRHLLGGDRLGHLAAAAALGAHDAATAAEVAYTVLRAWRDAGLEDAAAGHVLAALALGASDAKGQYLPVSDRVLWTWLDGPSDSIAAYELARRDEAFAFERLLADRASTVRVGALTGLGRSSRRDATRRLLDLSDDLVGAELRRAAFRAMVTRADPSTAHEVEEARRSDPDPEIRALAAAWSSSARRATSPLARGHEVFTANLVVDTTEGPQPARVARPSLASVVTADGMRRPVIVDPDGAIVAFRLPTGPLRLEVHDPHLSAPVDSGHGASR